MEQKERSDRELLQELAQGSAKAFNALYHRYYGAVGNIGFKYLQDRKVTEDLIQDIFAKVWTNRNQFGAVQNFEAYLVTMVKNQALLFIKAAAREMATKQRFALQAAVSDNNVDRHLLEKEHRERIAIAITELPRPHQQVFKLSKMDHMGRTEVAQHLNLSQQTVDNYLVLAVKAIREKLRDILMFPYWIAFICICS